MRTILVGLIVLIGLGTAKADTLTHTELQSIAALIERLHIDHLVVPTDSLDSLQLVLNGDGYSEYLSPEQYAWEKKLATTARTGLGVLYTRNFESNFNYPVPIFIPYTDGPAAHAGLRNPVEVLTVNGLAIADPVSFTEIISTAKKVQLQVRDLVTKEETIKTVAISSFTVPSVEVITVRGKRIIRLYEFIRDHTVLELRQFLKQQSKEQELVIIDLRYAIGGDLFEALDSLPLFIEQRVPLATIEYSDKPPITFYGRDDQKSALGPVYLIIGPSTASAAEMLARTLQNYGAAFLLGKPSYGKCTVQQLVGLSVPRGAALRLTVGRILDPKGWYCNGQGVIPDYNFYGNIHDTSAVLDSIMIKNKLRHDDYTYMAVFGPFRTKDLSGAVKRIEKILNGYYLHTNIENEKIGYVEVYSFTKADAEKFCTEARQQHIDYFCNVHKE